VEDAVQGRRRLRLRFAGLQLDADGNPVKFTATGVSQWTSSDTIDRMQARRHGALSGKGGEPRRRRRHRSRPLAPACPKARCGPRAELVALYDFRFRHCAGRAKRLYTPHRVSADDVALRGAIAAPS
jgi:hypothetical protein